MAALPQATLYVDLLSQPCRAVVLLSRCAGLGLAERALRLRVDGRPGDQRSDWFGALNPLRKLPLLVEGDGWALPESCAILRFLCATRPAAAEWYPVEPRLRARVDAALDWHHSTLRRGASTLVFLRRFVGVRGTGDARVAEAVATLRSALRQLDTVWLAAPHLPLPVSSSTPSSTGPFIAGRDVPSVADLILGCEVSQLELLGEEEPTMTALLAPHPALRAWLNAVRAATAPHWDDVHAKVAGLAVGPGRSAKL